MKTHQITVETTVNAPIEKVWKAWTEPSHIMQWNNATDTWHTPHATNDLNVGGKFLNRMEAKDGTMGFDFEGEYTAVDLHKRISYAVADGRKVDVLFEGDGNSTTVTETFEPESQNLIDVQRGGWQAILDNFKKYTESI